MNRFDDDKFSMTNVSLLEENLSSPPPPNRNLTSSPAPLTTITTTQRRTNDNRRFSSFHPEENNHADKDSRMVSTSLKSQESTLDVLKKENFNLKLRLYFLEERLRDASPESVDKAIKENINMKVALQSLTTELKKYKNMILELNHAVDILQSQTCPKQHGMSDQERQEFEKIKAEAEAYHDETDKLSISLANLTAENVKLRTTIRTSRVGNTSTSPPAAAAGTASAAVVPESDEIIELRRNYRQAKIKIEEQQRAMQMMNSNSTRSYGGNQDDEYRKMNQMKKQMEGEIRRERQETDRVYKELQDKNKEIHNLQLQLRNKSLECDQLRSDIDHMDVNRADMDEVIHAANELQEDNEELVVEINAREQDISVLEAEIEKLVSHLEEKDKEHTIERDMLKEDIRERDEKIEMLTNELKEVTESHDEDIAVIEEHIAKAQDDISKKEEENQELVNELENVKKMYEDEIENVKKMCEEALEKQYDEMIVSVRDREVMIASLEGNFEQKTDTMQRERDLFREEIGELKDKLHAQFDELREKDQMIQELSEALNNREQGDVSYVLQSDKVQEYIQTWENRSNELELKNEMMREKLDQAKAKIAGQQNIYNALKHKYHQLNEKHQVLNKIVDEGSKSSEKPGTTTTDTNRLTRELRKELEKKSHEYEHEKKRVIELEQLYQMEVDANESLAKQLKRRDIMMTNILINNDNLMVKGEFMENILIEQATGGHRLFREKTTNSF